MVASEYILPGILGHVEYHSRGFSERVICVGMADV